MAAQTANLAHYSSYPESALLPTANLMLNYVLKPIRHASFHRKYAGRKYLKVCSLPRSFVSGTDWFTADESLRS